MFAATFVDKNAEVDRENEGCDTTTYQSLMHEKIDVVSPTLAGLLRKLSEQFGYDGTYWDMRGEEGIVQWASFNQHEDAHGLPLTFDEVKTVWAAGGVVYLADYTFWIEEREVSAVSEDTVRELENDGYHVECDCGAVTVMNG